MYIQGMIGNLCVRDSVFRPVLLVELTKGQAVIRAVNGFKRDAHK